MDKIKISTCANILFFSPEDEYIELLRPQIDKLMKGIPGGRVAKIGCLPMWEIQEVQFQSPGWKDPVE